MFASITSDVFGAWGDPAPSLRRISEAGIEFVHWCHEWTSVSFYTDEEIAYIRGLLKQLNLKLLDTHATDGGIQAGLRWISEYQFYHEQGMALIANRIRFTHLLGGRAIVLHAPVEPTDPIANAAFWELMQSNLQQIALWAKHYGVRIAFENTDTFPSNVPTLEKILAMTDPEWFGLCLDTGHGNIHGNTHTLLNQYGGRLYALHLNDNDSDSDIHKLPLDGTVDWGRTMPQIKKSVYPGPLSYEVGMRSPIYDGMTQEAYLQRALEKMAILNTMLRAA